MYNVVFPPTFYALRKLPGYFWNSEDDRVYSIKSGSLKKLKLNKATPYSPAPGRHYRLTVNGKSTTLDESWIVDRVIAFHIVKP